MQSFGLLKPITLHCSFFEKYFAGKFSGIGQTFKKNRPLPFFKEINYLIVIYGIFFLY